jgi:hypothetical protein
MRYITAALLGCALTLAAYIGWKQAQPTPFLVCPSEDGCARALAQQTCATRHKANSTFIGLPSAGAKSTWRISLDCEAPLPTE